MFEKSNRRIPSGSMFIHQNFEIKIHNLSFVSRNNVTYTHFMLINFTNLELSNVWNTECLPHGVVGMVAGQRGSLLHQQLLQGDLLPDPVSSNTMFS